MHAVIHSFSFHYVTPIMDKSYPINIIFLVFKDILAIMLNKFYFKQSYRERLRVPQSKSSPQKTKIYFKNLELGTLIV